MTVRGSTESDIIDDLGITVGEEFRRAKRNLLFVTSLLFVISIAAPTAVKLPGFEGAKLPLVVGLILIWCWGAYLAWEYSIEYRYAEVKNKHFLVKNEFRTLSDVFELQLNRAREFDNLASQAIEVMKNIISDPTKSIVGTHTDILKKHDVSSLWEFESSVRPYMPPLKTYSQEEKQIWEIVEPYLQKYRNLLEDYYRQPEWEIVFSRDCSVSSLLLSFENLTEKFSKDALANEQTLKDLRKISSQIHGFHKAGFVWKDKRFPIAFCLISTIFAAFRVIQSIFF